MPKRSKAKVNKEPPVSKHHALSGRDAGAIAGEVAGAVLGSAGGPAGTVAGMVLGGMAGALTGEVLDRESIRSEVHERELDDEIGVTHGDLGAAQPHAPPARRGTPSAASCGATDGGGTPAEGPIQSLDE